MIRYCESCGRDVDTAIVTRQESYRICGEDIPVFAQVMVCGECGEELFCEELDSTTLLNAYNEYRRRHKLLFPDEIRHIREQYGLSQRSFAKLLNWGDKTIHRYESGAIQDRAHNSMLVFLREPENMRTYLSNNEILLENRQKTKLMDRVNQLCENADHSEVAASLRLLMSGEPSINNGFREFSYDKMCAMVLYFAHRSRELLKVKLLKLLNYSDMIFYKENGISISGASYIHLPYGPVPRNYDILFGMMTADHVAHIDIIYDNGYELHQVIPEREVPQGILSSGELSVMARVYDRFEDFGSSEISNYSHKEAGYRATRQGEVIPYSYAKEIVLDGGRLE